MGGYIANFTVYTMAMTGLICFAVFVYKKFTDGSMRKGETNFLSVEESMSLNPRKTLHVVRAGNEKFLIASDVDRTTLISRLDNNTRHNPVESLERFRNIELEQPVFHAEEIEIPQKQPKQQVHLEPINVNKPALDRRAGERKPAKSVTLDFDTPKSRGFSTMKEMAMKINEL